MKGESDLLSSDTRAGLGRKIGGKENVRDLRERSSSVLEVDATRSSSILLRERDLLVSILRKLKSSTGCVETKERELRREVEERKGKKNREERVQTGIDDFQTWRGGIKVK